MISALFLGLLPVVQSSVVAVSNHQSHVVQQLPLLPPQSEIILEKPLSASGVIVIDQQSGQTLYEHQRTEEMPVASLAKLMTAIVIAEHHALNEVVVVPQSVIGIEGNRAYITPGHRFTVGDLLSALLVASANDAAHALALYHSGTVESFVDEMNARAISLGLRSTSFANPIGFDDPLQYSTPQDIAWLTSYALKNDNLYNRMSSLGSYIVSSEGEVLHLYHTHTLIHQLTNVLAGKTGTTDEAKQCLSTLLTKRGRNYIVVLLHSDDRYKDLQTIMGSL